ncbi:MAG: sulfatase [Verrucomicrobia bacterium]|nr:sulfatase [Verrucomicrobiota bacterium]MCH8510415.1 sulfatase [Kiritimatiellia bacterium]
MELRDLLKYVGTGLSMAGLPHLGHGADKPADMNILMISVDDLRPQIFAHGQNLHGIQKMVTPNLDALIKDSVLFANNYCQVPICGASRLSLLTGTRPYKQPGENWGRHWTFNSRLDVASGNEPAGINHPGDTMVAHFRKHGFKTISVGGKIYHNRNDDRWDDLLRIPGDPWRNVVPYEIGDGSKTTTRGGTQYNNSEDKYYPDGWGAHVTMEKIEENKNKKWFMGYGIDKPHLPFWAPQKYWDLYPEDEISLPYNHFAPVNAPPESLGNWGELRNYEGIPSSGPLDDALARKLIRGYYASVSFADAQIGKVIDKLKNTVDENGVRLYDKTIIVLWGDHGWNLAEHTLWCKHANYRTSLQAPLVIRHPGMPGGRVTQRLTEFVDVYPTLCELTGTGMPATDHLEGTSLVPLMENPERPWKQAAFARFIRGDTIITERYSYSEFVSNDDVVEGRMLYDLSVDPDENYNIADLNPELVAELSALLGDGAAGKRNAWKAFVDTDNHNAPITTPLELPAPVHPSSGYPLTRPEQNE